MTIAAQPVPTVKPPKLAPTVRRTSHSWWAPYFFITPFLVIFALFVIYPLIQSAFLSTRFTAGPMAQDSRSVGGDNFRILFTDPLFWKAIRNTIFFAAGSLFTQMPCALALALLLNSKYIRGRAIFRLIFFSPYLMGLIFVGLLVNVMMQENTGLVNRFLNAVTGAMTFGYSQWPLSFPWLKEYTGPALVLTALWVYTGFNMIYFLAALQNVPNELLEAAHVDGAGPWRRFWHVTLPSIRPVASYIALLSLLGSFQLFELPYILFVNTGNPNGPSDQGVTIVMYLYQYAFGQGNLGRACAMGWILAIILMLFAIGYRVMARAEEK